MIKDSPPMVDEVDNVQWGWLRRRRFRTRSLIMVIALTAVWMGVLLDPQVGPLVLLLSGAFGITLAVMGVAMVLGLLGFGLCSACGRALGWLRRASQWPDE
jgi:hypothetical protein